MSATTLCELFAAHTAALAASDACSDYEWETTGDDLMATVEVTRDAILDHQPSTLAEVGDKAAYMTSMRSFTEWSDVDRIRLIRALMPKGHLTKGGMA